jgi:hypothetical protein
MNATKHITRLLAAIAIPLAAGSLGAGLTAAEPTSITEIHIHYGLGASLNFPFYGYSSEKHEVSLYGWSTLVSGFADDAGPMWVTWREFARIDDSFSVTPILSLSPTRFAGVLRTADLPTEHGVHIDNTPSAAYDGPRIALSLPVIAGDSGTLDYRVGGSRERSHDWYLRQELAGRMSVAGWTASAETDYTLARVAGDEWRGRQLRQEGYALSQRVSVGRQVTESLEIGAQGAFSRDSAHLTYVTETTHGTLLDGETDVALVGFYGDLSHRYGSLRLEWSRANVDLAQPGESLGDYVPSRIASNVWRITGQTAPIYGLSLRVQGQTTDGYLPAAERMDPADLTPLATAGDCVFDRGAGLVVSYVAPTPLVRYGAVALTPIAEIAAMRMSRIVEDWSSSWHAVTGYVGADISVGDRVALGVGYAMELHESTRGSLPNHRWTLAGEVRF